MREVREQNLNAFDLSCFSLSPSSMLSLCCLINLLSFFQVGIVGKFFELIAANLFIFPSKWFSDSVNNFVLSAKFLGFLKETCMKTFLSELYQ